MPTYAYACKDCSHAFDIQQSFTDDSLTVCPECRGTLRKKFNSVGVVFKGSGFHQESCTSRGSQLTVFGAAAGLGLSATGICFPNRRPAVLHCPQSAGRAGALPCIGPSVDA